MPWLLMCWLLVLTGQQQLCYWYSLLNFFLASAVIKSLWPNDAIWRHRYGSTLAQVMAWCRQAAPSHYLNQYSIFIKGVAWHSLESNFTINTQDIICKISLKITLLELALHLQWPLRPIQMADISRATSSNAFCWMKIFEFRLKFHWNLLPRVVVWLLTHICITRLQWVNMPLSVVKVSQVVRLRYQGRLMSSGDGQPVQLGSTNWNLGSSTEEWLCLSVFGLINQTC